MGIFRRKVPRHYVPIDAENVAKKDWAILLEVGTIVGEPHEKIRVAVATLDKKIVTKHNIFLRKSYFLVLDGYDPRIHALYFCPQLYKHEKDGRAPRKIATSADLCESELLATRFAGGYD